VDGWFRSTGLVGEPKENEMSQYTPGDRVAHHQYGDGTVQSVNEYHTVIDFDEHGSRTFSSTLVQLERSDSTAPVRPKGRRKTTKTAKV
jgi:hypothetical protein